MSKPVVTCMHCTCESVCSRSFHNLPALKVGVCIWQHIRIYTHKRIPTCTRAHKHTHMHTCPPHFPILCALESKSVLSTGIDAQHTGEEVTELGVRVAFAGRSFSLAHCSERQTTDTALSCSTPPAFVSQPGPSHGKDADTFNVG